MEDHFSYSQVRSFLSCEWKWYVDKVLGIRKVEVKRAPTLGSAIHEGVAAMIKDESVSGAIGFFIDSQFEKLEPHFGDMPSLGEDWDVVKTEIELHAEPIVNRWAEWIKLDDWETVVHPDFGPLVERRLVHVEKHNHLDLEFEFPWIVDWVAKHKPTDLTWVIDWKTKTQFQDDRVHELNLQKMVYQYLLDQIDVRVTGSRIAQIRSKVPSVPALNKAKKDGTQAMSRAAISTTWPIYKQALLDAGLEPDDYADMHDKMPAGDYWFNWMSTHRTSDEVDGAWRNIILPAIKRMSMLRTLREQDAGQPLRNLGSMDCNMMCNVQLLCLETLRGHDINNAIDFGFEKREE